MTIITRTSDQMRVCAFIKLHITAQSGPLSSYPLYATHIDPPKGGSVCVRLCVCVYLRVCSSHLPIGSHAVIVCICLYANKRGLSTYVLEGRFQFLLTRATPSYLLAR